MLSVLSQVRRAGMRAAARAARPSLSAQAVTAAPAPMKLQARWMATGDKSAMPLPSLGDSISEGTVLEWNKQVGEYVAEDEELCNVETDKVTVEVRSTKAGIVAEHCVAEGDSIEVGKDLVIIEEADPPAGGAAPAAAAPETPSAPATTQEAPAAPKQEAPKQEAPKKEAPKPAAAAEPQEAGSRNERRERMTRMRKRIAERLKDSQDTAAMLTTFQEIDMGNLIELRNTYKDAFAEKHGVKLGFMSPFLKASSMALQDIPAVNAIIEGDEIVYRDYCDVSVAVASPRGLVVPVIRNAEGQNLAELEQSLADLATKARNDSLSLEEMTGGTFTISNGGVFGSLFGTPIINMPQSAILGMHATKLKPRVVADGSIEARPVMVAALTYDHRLIDGREAVTFLVRIRDLIENPSRMLLDV